MNEKERTSARNLKMIVVRKRNSRGQRKGTSVRTRGRGRERQVGNGAERDTNPLSLSHTRKLTHSSLVSLFRWWRVCCLHTLCVVLSLARTLSLISFFRPVTISFFYSYFLSNPRTNSTTHHRSLSFCTGADTSTHTPTKIQQTRVRSHFLLLFSTSLAQDAPLQRGGCVECGHLRDW